jgi:hypothetical protein
MRHGVGPSDIDERLASITAGERFLALMSR